MKKSFGGDSFTLLYDLKNMFTTIHWKIRIWGGCGKPTAARRPTTANRQPEGSGKPTAASQLRPEGRQRQTDSGTPTTLGSGKPTAASQLRPEGQQWQTDSGKPTALLNLNSTWCVATCVAHASNQVANNHPGCAAHAWPKPLS